VEALRCLKAISRLQKVRLRLTDAFLKKYFFRIHQKWNAATQLVFTLIDRPYVLFHNTTAQLESKKFNMRLHCALREALESNDTRGYEQQKYIKKHSKLQKRIKR